MPDNETPIKGSNDSILKTVKWVATIAIASMGAGIVALTLFAGLSLNTEKSSLKDFKNDIKRDIDEQIQRIDVALSQIERKPEVVALSPFGEPLNGKTVEATVTKTDEGMKLYFSIILKNVGTANSDTLYIKWYSKKPLVFRKAVESTDEDNYDYEIFSDPQKAYPKDQTSWLPAKAAFRFKCSGPISGLELKPAKYPILMKIYYGSISPHVSKFFIEVKGIN